MNFLSLAAMRGHAATGQREARYFFRFKAAASPHISRFEGSLVIIDGFKCRSSIILSMTLADERRRPLHTPHQVAD